MLTQYLKMLLMFSYVKKTQTFVTITAVPRLVRRVALPIQNQNIQQSKWVLNVFNYFFFNYFWILCVKMIILYWQLINRNWWALRCSVTQHRQILYNVATKSLKGAVVTTKPRRSRKGRGAAAITTETNNNIDALMPPLDGRATAAKII